MKKPRTPAPVTPFEADLAEIPFSSYPRPQMRREDWLCLNGKWHFSLRSPRGEEDLGEILLPFPPESRISGIARSIAKDETMIYRRRFSLSIDNRIGRVILHFGAVDQYATVYLNGYKVGENEGGYLPLSFDITDHVIDGENTLTVEARDPLDRELPYGKQTNKRGGMWYTPVSGIWQTVWLERIPENAITSLRITPSLESVTVEVGGGVNEKRILVETEQGTVEHRFVGERFTLSLSHPHLWTPEDPYLYYFTLESGEDRVRSYLALRTVGMKKVGDRTVITLNERPYFFHGLLDQGYFSDGIFLPATEKGFENDILQMKACGFNMLRKHIKLEPDIFYYLCDKLGMIVFQDMVNSGKYSFLIDTALPTVFLKKGISHRATKRRRVHFMRTSEGIIDALYNHPSVCYYTVFNEGWGQFDADNVYTHLRAIDPTRIFDATSGWFKGKKSDVDSEHIYFKPVKLSPRPDRPIVLSEFGGYACKIEGHSFNLDKTYGYRYFADRQDFEDALAALYEKEIIPEIGNGLSAAVLTQVSDVEDETNGLLTYDRAVLKVDPARMKALAKRMKEAFEQRFR